MIAGHFARINEIRTAMGLQPLKWNAALATAAQMHANYQRLNNVQAHGEFAANPGYYAGGPAERATKAGYPDPYPGSLVTEVTVNSAGSTEADGRGYMDTLLAAPGHRTVLLAPEFIDVGMGASPLTTELGATSGVYVPPDLVILYPYNGQTGIPAAYAPSIEIPSPLPDVITTGMPITVQLGRLFSTFTIANASFKETLTGVDVPFYDEGQTTRAAYIFFPKAILRGLTAYTFSATVTIDGKTKVVSTTFTTVAP